MDDLASWVGRSETVRDGFVPTPVLALNATLDHPPLAAEPGAPLPPLWHCVSVDCEPKNRSASLAIPTTKCFCDTRKQCVIC